MRPFRKIWSRVDYPFTIPTILVLKNWFSVGVTLSEASVKWQSSLQNTAVAVFDVNGRMAFSFNTDKWRGFCNQEWCKGGIFRETENFFWKFRNYLDFDLQEKSEIVLINCEKILKTPKLLLFQQSFYWLESSHNISTERVKWFVLLEEQHHVGFKGGKFKIWKDVVQNFMNM